MILCCFFSGILILENNSAKEFIDKLKSKKYLPWILCFILGLLLSIGASVKFGPYVIFNINYPQFIFNLLSLFRATGRFVWLPCYIIFTGTMYFMSKYSKGKKANIIILICLIIQIMDLYPAMNNKFNYDKMGKDYNISKDAWEQVLENSKHIIYFRLGEISYDEMREGYYKIAKIAMENNCTLNNFYFAREINNVKETIYKSIENLKKAELEKDCIYVIKQNSDSKWWNESLDSLELDGYIVIKQSNKL